MNNKLFLLTYCKKQFLHIHFQICRNISCYANSVCLTGFRMWTILLESQAVLYELAYNTPFVIFNPQLLTCKDVYHH